MSTQFSSVSPEHFEGEFEYDCRIHGEECYGCVYEQERYIPYQQHNSVNRLLLAARRARADGFLADFCEGFLAERNTEHAEIDHAQRVLTRLANFQKESA